MRDFAMSLELEVEQQKAILGQDLLQIEDHLVQEEVVVLPGLGARSADAVEDQLGGVVSLKEPPELVGGGHRRVFLEGYHLDGIAPDETEFIVKRTEDGRLLCISF